MAHRGGCNRVTVSVNRLDSQRQRAMTYLNFYVPDARTDDFMSASTEVRGIWVSLAIYCTEQENAGIIKDCAKWTESHWQRAVGVAIDDVKHSSTLWKWSGDAVIVAFYNHKYEHLVKSRRLGAAMTNQKRWGKKTRRGSVSASTVQSLSDTLSESVSESLSESQERKGKKIPRASARATSDYRVKPIAQSANGHKP